MDFESRERRRLFQAIGLALVPDVAIGVVAAFVYNEWAVFFFALIALQVMYWVLWAKASAWAWLLFWAGGRKAGADQMFYYLKRNEFPAPRNREISAAGYFERVISDPGNPIEVRLKAAHHAGEMEALERLGETQASMRIAMIMEDAIERYGHRAE